MILTDQQTKLLKTQIAIGFEELAVVEKVTAHHDTETDDVDVYVVCDQPVSDEDESKMFVEAIECVHFASAHDIELSGLVSSFHLVTNDMPEPKNLGWVYQRDVSKHVA